MNSETESLLKKMPTGLMRDASRYVVGVTLLLTVAVLWTASNFITNALETGDSAWNKPFLITYLNTASFVLYLVPALIRHRRGQSHSFLPKINSEYEPLPQSESSTRRSASLTRNPSDTPVIPLEEAESASPAPAYLTIKETAILAAWWSAVWFLANWALSAALAMTSVASVTILSSTSGFFTLALGRICGVEDLTRIKVFAVLASFIGVFLVTRSDSSLSTASPADDQGGLPTHPVLGDVGAIFSAGLYAIYVVLVKVRVGDEGRADVQLMLGFAGLYNIICLIPVFPLLHWSGLETFQLPPTREAWTVCLINMCITLTGDYLYVLAVLKTSPMLVTIGLSLTIPMALVGSLFIPSSSAAAMTFLSLFGAALVCVGFGMLGWQGWEDVKASESATVARQQDDTVSL